MEEPHVDCTDVAIRIVKTSEVVWYDVEEVWYDVEIAAATTWTVPKRYSDFLTLDAALKAKFPTMGFPPLPPKKTGIETFAGRLFGGMQTKVI